MRQLPDLFDTDDALAAFQATSFHSKALLSKIVATLHGDGLRNKEIRELLNIKKDYLVSQLKRCGSLLTDEQLNLWHNNPSRITLGHVRAICSLPDNDREQILRKLLTARIPVSELESMTSKKEQLSKEMEGFLIQYCEKFGEVTGRIINLTYDPDLKVGRLSVSWHGFDDLSDIVQKFGFDESQHL